MAAITLIPVAAGHPNPRVDTAQRLNRGLAGTPMAGLGFVLEAEGRRGGVHPAFVAAAAGLESAWGRRACRGNELNVWGLGSCGRSWSPPTFVTWRQAIRYYVRFVRERWPAARTPYDLHGYCECGVQAWGSRVAWNMDRLGFPPVVVYGKGER